MHVGRIGLCRHPLLGEFQCWLSPRQLLDGLEHAAEHLPVGEWSEMDAIRMERAARLVLARLEGENG